MVTIPSHPVTESKICARLGENGGNEIGKEREID